MQALKEAIVILKCTAFCWCWCKGAALINLRSVSGWGFFQAHPVLRNGTCYQIFSKSCLFVSCLVVQAAWLLLNDQAGRGLGAFALALRSFTFSAAAAWSSACRCFRNALQAHAVSFRLQAWLLRLDASAHDPARPPYASNRRIQCLSFLFPLLIHLKIILKLRCKPRVCSQIDHPVIYRSAAHECGNCNLQ